MKLLYLVVILLPLVACFPTDLENVELDNVENVADSTRSKRSNVGIFASLQKNLFGASASLSSGSSGSSSGHSSGHDSHEDTHNEPHHDTKSFDGWQLKKSILNTLFQAVKAITGGVTTLKGQLIKGSGYLVSAKGKLISAGGEAVSNQGKKIVESAQLIHKDPHAPNHFAKLSAPLAGITGGIASLSSGSNLASLSGSSSGHKSPSPHHDDDHSSHEVHGETYSSYDGPSYTFSGQSSPSYTYSNSFGSKPTHSAYGAPSSYSSFGSPHSANTIRLDKKRTEEAHDLLHDILKSMPQKPSKTLEEHTFDNHNTHHTKVKQYVIPQDPHPQQYTIIHSQGQYLPPITQTSQSYLPPSGHDSHSAFSSPSGFKQSITTAFGAPSTYNRQQKRNDDGRDLYHAMSLKIARKDSVKAESSPKASMLIKVEDERENVGQAIANQLINDTQYQIQKSVEVSITEKTTKG